MKCPRCGNEIEGDKLLCEFCGEEIKFVPLFDAEIENQIDETINNIAKTILASKEQGDEKKEEDILPEENDNAYQHMAIVILGVIVALIIVWFVVNGILKLNKNNSFDYQYDKAVEFIDEGNYDEAIKYMEHALKLNEDDVMARTKLGELYIKTGQYKSGILVLEELLKLGFEDTYDAYEVLLSSLYNNGDYDKLAFYLSECPYEDLSALYVDYAAFSPEFNYEEGVYSEKLELILSDDNPKGIIYYTLDGSKPTTNSMVYNNPIVLKSGDYTVNAMFVNMYGLCSEIVTKSYYISLSLPPEPEVTLDTGTYDEPQFIEVFHDKTTKIYYTMDGTIPTSESSRYTEPFEMPIGTSNVAFIAINSDGLASNVVRRTYQLSVDTIVKKDLVIDIVKNNLIVSKKIIDSYGHIDGDEGNYEYLIRTIVEQANELYYIVDEYYVDNDGNTSKSNDSYAVNANNGNVYKAIKTGEGKYILKNL